MTCAKDTSIESSDGEAALPELSDGEAALPELSHGLPFIQKLALLSVVMGIVIWFLKTKKTGQQPDEFKEKSMA